MYSLDVETSKLLTLQFWNERDVKSFASNNNIFNNQNRNKKMILSFGRCCYLNQNTVDNVVWCGLWIYDYCDFLTKTWIKNNKSGLLKNRNVKNRYSREMSGYRSVNFMSLCRLCITGTGSKTNIFSAEGRKKKLFEKIKDCLPAAVSLVL